MPPPLVTAYLALALIVYPVAWLKGGHPERLGATICFVTSMGGNLFSDFYWGEVRIGEAVLDVVTVGLFAGMALTGRRWWLCAAAAVMVLILITHAAPPLMADLQFRGGAVARIGLSNLLLLTILGGVGERWLAGEAPVRDVRRQIAWKAA